MLLLAAPPAAAQESQGGWEHLYDTLLLQAGDHDIDGALAGYGDLVRNLGADDPVRSAALYWLGRTRYEQGDVDGARTSLRECVRIGIEKARCLELLGHIELEQSAIRHVPVHWTFDDTTHGFVHPWRYADKGSIRIHREGDLDDPMLAWRTSVDVRTDDELVVGFDNPKPPPSGVKFLLRSRDMNAYIRLRVYDIYGRQYGAAPPHTVVRVPKGQMIVVELPFDEVVGDDPDAVPFDARNIDRLVVQDVTAYHGDRTGENELTIDDFQVY